MGPDELVRISHVARRHYLDGRTKIEIAEELGLSRFKIARMLEDALEQGLVKITIEAPDSLDLDLSMQLRARFGLTRALAVITPGTTPELIQDRLGRAAADLLSEIVTDGDVLGLTAGRTLTAMAGHLRTLATCEVVQLAGVAAPTPENGVEVIRQVSRISGGRSRAIFAPLLVETAATASALRREPGIMETFRRFDSVTKAVVAVGSWSPPDSQLYDNAGRAGALDELLAAGVKAEICATLIDESGAVVGSVAERSLAVSTEQLRHIPEVIAVAGGPSKTGAVIAALRSGIVDSLVTDAALARRLLESPV
ncbi:Sorbitol operon regulator [Microbacterium oxydans]|uniref:Sorbitol operon regulator n=1 Tax=Microbacterium oxydans TaxID=82380 RepID=A0A0F0KMJ1_9MICO|nr:sugar-binding domain-containing protein [Microbacterium oxydans]KJL22117.1 Sorbitol operon regulator [Microbacterium oxydans]